jgi:hypothetical protein
MSDTYLTSAYNLGVDQAIAHYTKESSSLARGLFGAVSKNPGIHQASKFVASNPLAYQAGGGAIMGGIAGGEDNRLLGALAGAGAGLAAGRFAPRVPQMLRAPGAGPATINYNQVAGNLQAAGLVGGAGLGAGLGMNALGLTDRPQGFMERYFG